MGNPTYRLPGPKGKLYLIELYAGCSNCGTPPGITIHEVTKDSWNWDEAKETELLPFNHFDGMTEMPIKCGMDPDEFSKAVVAQVGDSNLGNEKLDAITADQLAEDVWKESINVYPTLIQAGAKVSAA